MPDKSALQIKFGMMCHEYKSLGPDPNTTNFERSAVF